MRFTKAVFACTLASALGAIQNGWATEAQPLSHADHAKTVDELLSAETGELSAKSHPVAEVKHAMVISATPTDVLEVGGVWGVTGNKHALITLDGAPATVSVGDPVGRFKVSSIGGGCVELQALKVLPKSKWHQPKPRRAASVTPFGSASEVEHRKSCFHEASATAAPVGLMPAAAQVPTRAAPAPLPIVPPIVPVPGNTQLTPVQLPK